MADLANITDFKAEYSENVLPITALISDDTIVNYTGDIVLKSDAFSFDGAKSLRLNKTMTITSYDSVFDLGSALTFTPNIGGNYFFSFRLLDNTAYNDPFPINITLKVYINSVLTYTFLNVFDLGQTIQNNWYTFAQNFELGEGFETSFSFEVEAPYPGTPNPTLDIYMGGFKCELDDRLLNIPSVYSKPKDYDISETKGYLKNLYHGWGYYADSLSTPSLSIGTTYTQITIDALGALTNTNYLPLEIRGTSELWSGNKITPIAVGDDYDGRFDVTISAKSGAPSYIEVILDISGSTAGTNKVFTGYIQTGSATPYDQSLPLDFFGLDTFLANGGRLYARVDTGSVTLTRRNIKISRKSKAF